MRQAVLLSAATAVGVGVLLVVVGVVAPAGRFAVRPPVATLRTPLPLIRICVVCAMFAVMAYLTALPGAGLLIGVGTWFLLGQVMAQRSRSRSLAQAAAVEEWVRRLSDVLVIGMGLGQAIVVTADSAPAPIRPAIQRLASRLEARVPLPAALIDLAEEIADPGADLAVAALVLAAGRRGPGLAAALHSVCSAIAADVIVRREVDADRASSRTTARAVTAITLLVAFVGLLNHSYVAPYAEPVGQVVLVAIAAFFGVALFIMNAIAATPSIGRLRFTAP